MNSAQDRPPSVDRLARSLADSELPHPLLVEVARDAISQGQHDDAPSFARRRGRKMLTPVINGTGVLLHTNMGRAPLDHHQSVSYTNLELDLETGNRGSRQETVGATIATAVGTEAAMVVNNCAGAVLLCLAALAAGRGVAVSRGELVEIGGGFRIPEVMEQSGANLIEVGTTNRTRLADFANAEADLDNDLALVMSIHQSNYRIVGFTESVSVKELASLRTPVVADIGSGLLDAACPWLPGSPPKWLSGEPAAKQTIEAGADLVLFSGDKLLGGPQAGIIAGRADLVARCSRHPLARALRPGGLVLHALQNTMLAYLRGDGSAIPLWNMASRTVTELTQRSDQIIASVTRDLGSNRESSAEGTAFVRTIETESVPGGGTLPGVTFPSAGLVIPGDQCEELRRRDRPILGRIEDGQTVLDLRTVDPDDDVEIASALVEISPNSPQGIS